MSNKSYQIPVTQPISTAELPKAHDGHSRVFFGDAVVQTNREIENCRKMCGPHLRDWGIDVSTASNDQPWLYVLALEKMDGPLFYFVKLFHSTPRTTEDALATRTHACAETSTERKRRWLLAEVRRHRDGKFCKRHWPLAGGGGERWKLACFCAPFITLTISFQQSRRGHFSSIIRHQKRRTEGLGGRRF